MMHTQSLPSPERVSYSHTYNIRRFKTDAMLTIVIAFDDHNHLPGRERELVSHNFVSSEVTDGNILLCDERRC